MSEYSGVVQRILTRNWGNKTFWSFTLSGVDGIFGTGIKKPPMEGASVVFQANQNPKGYLEVDTKSIQYKTDGAPSTAERALEASQASITAAKHSNGSPPLTAPRASQSGYWEDRAKRDLVNDAARELGASRNTALNFIDIALKHEVFKLPAQAKREEFLWALLDHYTAKLMGKSIGTNQAEISQESDVTQVDEDWK